MIKFNTILKLKIFYGYILNYKWFVVIPIANGSEEIETMSIYGTFVRAEAKVFLGKVLTEGEDDNLMTTMSRGVQLMANLAITEDTSSDDYDAIILPGGVQGAKNFAASKILTNLVKTHLENGKILGAICATPALFLEANGLLEGHKATCYPSLSEKLTDQSKAKERIVVSDNLITGNGPATAVDFSVTIVEKIYGLEKAQKVALSMATKYWD